MQVIINTIDNLVYVSAGSNIGDREAHLKKAVTELKRQSEVDLIRVSSLFETEPWGRKEQPFFLNCVIEIRTRYDPNQLLDLLKQIESNEGRKLSVVERWGPRVLDLDILIFGDRIVQDVKLVIPHPGLVNRRFMLEPLMQLCPDLLIPGYRMSVSQTLDKCKDSRSVVEIHKGWLD